MSDKIIKEAPSIKVNAAFNVIRNLMILLFPLITFPYASRILLPDGIGKVAFARTFVDYFITVATLGIGNYGIRETAKVRDDRQQLSKVSQEILTINMISTAVSYTLLFTAIFIVPKLAEYRVLLIVISAKILFTALGLDWLYGGVEDYKYITVRSFIFQAISVIALFVFVHKPEDYLIYASIAVFANVGSNVCNWIHSKKYVTFFSGFDLKLEFKKHLVPIFTLFAMAEVTRLYNALDVTMLGFICGDWEVGIYSAATKINRIIIQLVVAIGVVVLPRLAYYLKKNEKEKYQELALKNFEIFSLLSIPCAVGLCLIGDSAILFFCGSNFNASVPIMRFMTPMIAISGISHVVGTQTLVPTGRERFVLYSLVIGAISNVVLNFILIPKYQIWGAAVSTLISQGVLSGMELYWCRDIINLCKVGRYFAVYLGHSLVMAAAVFLVLLVFHGHKNITIIAICIGLMVYGLMLYITKNSFLLELIETVKKRIR